MPFRKPLEPTEVEGDMVDVPEGAEAKVNLTIKISPYIEYILPFDQEVPIHTDYIDIFKRKGIIYFGAGSTISRRETMYLASRISKIAGYPIFSDCLSDLRQSMSKNLSTQETTFDYKPLVAYENYLNSSVVNPEDIEVIIRFGSPPISKNMLSFMSNISPIYHLYADPTGIWADDNHTTTHYVYSHSTSALQNLIYGELGALDGELAGFQRQHDLSQFFTKLESTTWQTIDHEISTGQYFDGAVVYDVVDLIPDESTLFAGNSLSVRHLDQFGKPTTKRIYAYANRGASGIDGNISTALGTGAARPDKPLVAILGDITFYHDMNGLLAVHRCGIPITIVLINNDGGGIFNRLPIRDFEPEFTDYFLTPHGLNFSHAAKLYGLDYLQIDAYSEGAREAFRQTFSENAGSGKSTIIEVRTDSRRDEARRQEIIAAVHEKLRDLGL
jgi:2-succinyl-5-enolpyruvyl-6-hydroxy-3-cyclohexene-1-carboxylate synthase